MKNQIIIAKASNGYVLTDVDQHNVDSSAIVCNHFDSVITHLRSRFGEHRPVFQVLRPLTEVGDDKAPARGEPNE
jgi:hypothetical protein